MVVGVDGILVHVVYDHLAAYWGGRWVWQHPQVVQILLLLGLVLLWVELLLHERGVMVVLLVPTLAVVPAPFWWW